MTELVESLGDDEERAVFFDLETDYHTRKITQIGIVLVQAITATVVKEMEYYVLREEDTSEKTPTSRVYTKAPQPFDAISDRVYAAMHGRTWIGYNCNTFDIPILQKAFQDAGKKIPRPSRVIDVLELFREWWGRTGERVGLQSLALEKVADRFGLGKQTHRAIDDARLLREVFVLACAGRYLAVSVHTRPVGEHTSSSTPTSPRLERKKKQEGFSIRGEGWFEDAKKRRFNVGTAPPDAVTKSVKGVFDSVYAENFEDPPGPPRRRENLVYGAYRVEKNGVVTTYTELLRPVEPPGNYAIVARSRFHDVGVNKTYKFDRFAWALPVTLDPWMP